MANITGTAGADSLKGTAGADTLNGLGGDDTLLGGNGNDSLVGGAGADSLVGGAGIDTLSGGGGNDTYVIDASDVLADNGGIDTVRADFTYTLFSGFENLVLTGTAAINGTGNSSNNVITGNSAANVLVGDAGNDVLSGGGGTDSLDGGTGNDTLDGGSGNDTLRGGDGNDVLVFQAGDASVQGGAGTDSLRVDGSGVNLDLTAVANTVHRDIEVIELTGSGANALTVARGDVIAISSSTDTLKVVADAGDAMSTTDAGWLHTLNIKAGGQTYAQYTNGAATLQVDLDADRSGVDTTLPVIQLSALSGVNGFRLDGIDAYDRSGTSVASAGDVNGDGFDDLIIGAPGADPGGDIEAGETYVVFGRASGFASSIDLGALDGANGFRLDANDVGEQSAFSVASAGDVNGDGFDDFIIGAYTAVADGAAQAGQSYVVFGKASGFASSVDLASLDGTTGFVLDGIDPYDSSGRSVASAGDVNGDGFDDFIIGAQRGDPGGHAYAGESYVVFGKASGFASSLDLSTLDGTTGFRVDGIDANDLSGCSVASAGDVNGDGFDDLIIGAFTASPTGDSQVGESYVVFGKSSGFASSMNLSTLDGTNGFALNGIDGGDQSGFSVASAGDVNGDGFGDLIIGARYADPDGVFTASESYVVFGKSSGFASAVDLSTLDGSSGFRVDGIDTYDRSGWSVDSAGDVNGDGFDDLIIGAWSADPGGDTSAGETYVVFGKASGFASSMNVSTLDGTNGFRLDGIDASDYSGRSVSAAGDVNGDGFDDLMVGAQGADPAGHNLAGESYVVFGGDFTGAVTHLGTNVADALIGTTAAETFVSGQGNDKITGGGGADVIRAGAGNDQILVSNTNFADIDGGSGTDTLKILGGGRTLDLTARANSELTGIERINLTGGGDNTLVLSDLDLFDLSDTDNQLTVDGNGGDTVDLVGTWSDDGAGATYHTYTLGAATILIDNDIFVT